MSLPTVPPGDYETGGYDDEDMPAARLSARQARDVAGLALVVAGLAGLAALGFTVDWRVGAAACCLLAVAAGLLLGRA